MKKYRCILTGGAGFLGMNVARGLVNSGHEVVVIDKKPLISDCTFDLQKKMRFIPADFKDLDKSEDVFQKGDILFHFAYSALPGTPLNKMGDDIKENVFESVKLFEMAIKKGIKKIIFPSSGGTVYGEVSDFPIKEGMPTNPICSYGITKLMLEKYILFLSRMYGVGYLIYRISNSYGWGQSVHSEQGLIVNALVKMLNGSQITIFGDDHMVRDYIYIDDIVNAFILGVEKDIRDDIYNIGTGRGYSIKEIIELVSKTVGVCPKVIYSNKRLVDVEKSILDPTKIRLASGWEAKVSLEEGISKTHKWVKSAIY